MRGAWRAWGGSLRPSAHLGARPPHHSSPVSCGALTPLTNHCPGSCSDKPAHALSRDGGAGAGQRPPTVWSQTGPFCITWEPVTVPTPGPTPDPEKRGRSRSTALDSGRGAAESRHGPHRWLSDPGSDCKRRHNHPGRIQNARKQIPNLWKPSRSKLTPKMPSKST